MEVDRSGVTESCVFRGAIRVQVESAPGSHQKESRAVDLKENDSVRVEQASAADSSPRITVVRKVAQPERFVRTLPPPQKPSPLKILAYFRLGEDDPGAKAGQPAAQQTVNHGHSLKSWRHLEKYGSPSYTANTAAPGSSLAMNFTGGEGQYLFAPYTGWSPNDNFILEAWARPTQKTGEKYSTYVVYKGVGYTDGYGLGLSDGNWFCLIGVGDGWWDSGVACQLDKWVHLALVRNHGKLQFWMDGRLAKDFGDRVVPIAAGGQMTIGGAQKASQHIRKASTVRSTRSGYRSSVGRSIPRCSCSSLRQVDRRLSASTIKWAKRKSPSMRIVNQDQVGRKEGCSQSRFLVVGTGFPMAISACRVPPWECSEVAKDKEEVRVRVVVGVGGPSQKYLLVVWPHGRTNT